MSMLKSTPVWSLLQMAWTLCQIFAEDSPKDKNYYSLLMAICGLLLSLLITIISITLFWGRVLKQVVVVVVGNQTIEELAA